MIFDENESNDTNIIQYCILHGLGLCIKLNSFVAHIFYVWSFSHNKEVPIDINQNKKKIFKDIHYCFCLGSCQFELKYNIAIKIIYTT